MAITTTILKNTKRQAAVLCIGTGSATISVYDLRHPGPNATTDIQTIDQTKDCLTITDLYYDVSTTSNITRNGNVIWSMNAGIADFRFAQEVGVSLNHSANANVVVNIGGTANGSVLVQFTKGPGYVDRDLQNQGPGVGTY